MCQKIMRSPFARGGIAKYLGTFVADATDRGFTRDTQWLIWKYESDTTLAEASQVCRVQGSGSDWWGRCDCVGSALRGKQAGILLEVLDMPRMDCTGIQQALPGSEAAGCPAAASRPCL